jgi:hypothetical protein
MQTLDEGDDASTKPARPCSPLTQQTLTGDKADETVLFGIDGREFEIDLSRDHAGELRDNLARYLAKARKVGKLTAVSTPSKRTASGQRQSLWGSRSRSAPPTCRDWGALPGKA